MLALKITSAGDLVWQRTYTAGSIADARGGLAVASDGSVVIAGVVMIPKAGVTPNAALMVKLSADGNLVFDKQFDLRRILRRRARENRAVGTMQSIEEAEEHATSSNSRVPRPWLTRVR